MRYGGLVALNAVDLTVAAGGVVAVIGPNGSGKSTLFNVITGMTPADGGAIHFDAADLLGLPPHQLLRRGIARTFQNIRLFTNLSVLDNVLIGQHARYTGPIAAVFRPPATKRDSSGSHLGHRNPLDLATGCPACHARQPSYANRRRVEIA